MLIPGRTPFTVEDVAAEFRAHAGRRGLSQTQIADALGVSRMWVSRRMRGDDSMSLSDFASLCFILETTPVEVLSQVANLAISTPAATP
jgi:transcriptional regulator with XRE-family HTH domain